MIIICPNCITRYNIRPALLGTGRNSRCFNCGHSWFQKPVVSPPPPPMAPQRPAMAMQPAMMAPGTQSSMAPKMMPQAGHAQPIPEHEPKHEEPDFDAVLATDNEAGSEPEETNDIKAVDEGEEDESLSQEDLDAIFSDADDPEPIGSISDGAPDDDDDDEVVPDLDFDDLPEPDPIPNVFTPGASDEDAKKKPRSLFKTIIIGVFAFLIVLLATLVFARGFITDLMPLTKSIYEMIGLGEKLGAGLKIGNAKPTRGTSRGKEALIVTGVITNVSEDTRPVPLIKAALLDGENREIQHSVAAPLKSELPAGKRMKFKVTLIEPSPLARRIEVAFAAPEEASKKD